MRDWSTNIPSWAYREGYRLEGGQGTYDELFLIKRGKYLKRWNCTDRIPNIFEVEELINDFESQKIRQRC